MPPRRRLRVWMCASALALAPACAHPPGPMSAADRVTGTVTFLQRIALSPSAEIEVTLVDVSRADAPADVLAAQRIVAAGRQVPFPFELAFDPARIDERFTYAVQARVTDGGALRFISDRRHAVLTHGAPRHVDVVVVPVGGRAEADVGR